VVAFIAGLYCSHTIKNALVLYGLTFGTGVLHLNFSTPVCKMLKIQEPKKVAL